MAYVWPFRFSRWLEALVNAKGGSVLNDIDPNVKAVAMIMEGNEDRYLQGWNRYGIAQTITGAAGNLAAVELHNPIGTNVVGVVERIGVSIGPATASLFIVTITPGPALIADFGIVQAPKLDGRQNSNSSLLFSTTTAGVGFANNLMYGTVNSGSEFEFIQTLNQEIVLMPGSAIIVADNTQAEQARFDLTWRERALQQSELT